MWKIAICDDEPYVHEDIKQCLQLCELEERVQMECFLTGEELLCQALQENYDLIYLDIKLPGENGIDIARKLREQDCNTPIIFLTNYDEYLEVGYEVDAFRYRFKPIDQELFQKDFQAWKRWIDEHRVQTITITTAKGNYQVAMDDILFLEIVKRKVHIVTKEGVYIALENMLYWERLLTGFISPYNKILVNKKYVKYFDDTKVILEGEHKLPVSRRKYQQFCAGMMK